MAQDIRTSVRGATRPVQQLNTPMAVRQTVMLKKMAGKQ